MSEGIMKQGEQIFMYTYRRYPIVLERGEGVYVYDTKGKEYLEFTSGIGVAALGYGNEDYKTALKQQIDLLLHTSNYFYSEATVKAAKEVCNATGMNRVFFTNSGTEAVEGAIKLARKYYYQKYHRADSELIALHHSFHGRSMGALAVTGTPSYRVAFEPLIGKVKFATLNDIKSIRSQITSKTCAILLETIQGEGGIYPASKEFLKEIRKICDEHDIVFILDEIQCGMGRTGFMFAYEGYGVKPDIVTCAKALGCGVPVGAFAAVEKIANAFEPGDHGTTYGGNPLVAAAINQVFESFKKEKIIEHVRDVSMYLEHRLDELVKRYDFIKERRGKGLMQGLEFTHSVKDYIRRAMKEGVILISAGEKVIRFLPPLVIEKEHVDEMIEKLTNALEVTCT